MKVIFLNALRVEEVTDSRWIVHETFRVRVDERIIRIPAGFQTDFASVPRLPLVYLAAGGCADRSAVVHDYLYSRQMGKDYADSVFLAAMEAEGVPAWRRYPMYWAVSLFGGAAYEGHAKKVVTAP